MTPHKKLWADNQPPIWTQMSIKDNFYHCKWNLMIQNQLTKLGTTKFKTLKKNPDKLIMGIEALSHTPELHNKILQELNGSGLY